MVNINKNLNNKYMTETLYNETYNSDGLIIKREIVERYTDSETGEITLTVISVEEY